ncbi:uncharacterized protein A4U43_C04F6930 [Asparagus officinalis]|uniref:Uncharacterized protein n=1 Tax=Asparagus officinalis TaxID=4686 RepID=A0A5P1EYT2_ASPOF|nr:uncharacterized protein A4U43_C04F6930 [Asparagus officinalis]
MAMRSAIARIPELSRFSTIEASSLAISRRCFSDGKGKILSEEERAAENVYIQKKERERAEKARLKEEKEKAKLEKEKAEKGKALVYESYIISCETNAILDLDPLRAPCLFVICSSDSSWSSLVPYFSNQVMKFFC